MVPAISDGRPELSNAFPFTRALRAKCDANKIGYDDIDRRLERLASMRAEALDV